MDTIDDNLMSGGGENFIPQESTIYLAETRKWAKFLSILGFVFMALMVVIGFAMGGLMSSIYGLDGGTGGPAIPGFLFGVIYLIFAVIYFFPIYYLFKFTSHMKSALTTNNANELNASFKNLKSHYKFMGIFAIIMLAFYALMIIIMLAGGGLAMLSGANSF